MSYVAEYTGIAIGMEIVGVPPLVSIPAVAVPILYPDPLSLVLGLMVVFVFVLAGPGILMEEARVLEEDHGACVSSGRTKSANWASLGAVLSFGIVALLASV